MALFWSRGVDVLINMPAASLGRSRKRGDLVKERDGTRWNVCPFCLDLLIRLNVDWSGSYGSQESVNCTGNCCDCLTPKSG